MIEKLLIENFQKHKKTVINFTKGLNVIAGETDSGKSSVIRSLLWVIKNRPSGDGIRNWDSKKHLVRVDITLDDHTVSKERINNKVTYTLDECDGLEAVGRDVPSEVSSALNITDINIQPQHDPYFLLTMSPGNVAKVLNDLAGLSVIDNSFKALNSSVTLLQRQKTEKEQSIKNIDDDLATYEGLDEIKELIESAEKTQLSLKNIGDKIDNLTELINYIDDLKYNIDNYKKRIKAQKPVEELFTLVEEYEKLNDDIKDLESLLRSIKLYKDRRNALKMEWENLIQEYNDKLNSAKVCPTCLRPLDKKAIEALLK